MAISEELIIQIKSEVENAVSGLRRVEDQTKSLKVVSIASFISIAKAGFNMGKQILGEINKIIDVYKKQEIAETKLATTLKATGNQVGYTAKQMKKMASELQNVGVLGDEAIIEAQAMLLTFKEIGHDTFPRATKAAADMALMFGGGAGGLQSATIMLGKALNDPIQGLGALRRIGIQLTGQQEEMVKHFVSVNDIASAQAIILGEVESQFGGLNEAMGESATGKIDQFVNSFNDLTEQAGEFLANQLVPLIEEMKPFIKDLIEITKWINSWTKAGEQNNKTQEKFISNLAASRDPLTGIIEGTKLFFSSIGRVAKNQNEANEELENASSILDEYNNSIIEGTTALDNHIKKWKEQAKIWRGIDDESIKKRKEATEKKNKFNKEYTDKYFKLTHSEIEVLEKQRDEEIKAAKEIGASTYMVKKYYNEKINELKEKEKENNFKYWQSVKDAAVEGRDIYKQVMDNQVYYNNTAMDKIKDKTKETMDEVKNEYLKIKNEWGGVITGIEGLSNQYFENEITRVETSTASEEEKARKIKEIKKKQFTVDKIAAVIKSIIDTATAVVEALPNIPLSITVGAIGAVQTALIASQPMPAFARGGSFQTQGPQTIVVGDNPSGVENINITSPESGNNRNVRFVLVLDDGSQLTGYMQRQIDGGHLRTERAS